MKIGFLLNPMSVAWKKKTSSTWQRLFQNAEISHWVKWRANPSIVDKHHNPIRHPGNGTHFFPYLVYLNITLFDSLTILVKLHCEVTCLALKVITTYCLKVFPTYCPTSKITKPARAAGECGLPISSWPTLTAMAAWQNRAEFLPPDNTQCHAACPEKSGRLHLVRIRAARMLIRHDDVPWPRINQMRLARRLVCKHAMKDSPFPPSFVAAKAQHDPQGPAVTLASIGDCLVNHFLMFGGNRWWIQRPTVQLPESIWSQPRNRCYKKSSAKLFIEKCMLFISWHGQARRHPVRNHYTMGWWGLISCHMALFCRISLDQPYSKLWTIGMFLDPRVARGSTLFTVCISMYSTELPCAIHSDISSWRLRAAVCSAGISLQNGFDRVQCFPPSFEHWPYLLQALTSRIQTESLLVGILGQVLDIACTRSEHSRVTLEHRADIGHDQGWVKCKTSHDGPDVRTPFHGSFVVLAIHATTHRDREEIIQGYPRKEVDRRRKDEPAAFSIPQKPRITIPYYMIYSIRYYKTIRYTQ